MAEKIRRAGESLELNVKIRSIENPRKEAESHYYNPAHTGLLDLGLRPHPLSDEVLGQMIETVLRHREEYQQGSDFPWCQVGVKEELWAIT